MNKKNIFITEVLTDPNNMAAHASKENGSNLILVSTFDSLSTFFTALRSTSF